jgi:ribosome biogenesis GTPase A
MDGVAVLEAVAKKRGCVVQGRRGGDLDLEKAAMVLLTDYRGGKLGRVSLESPQSRAAILAAAVAEKAAPSLPE